MAPAGLADPFGLVGAVVERQFRVDALVGEGGFGVVYKGWHLTLEQPVAIKALKMPDAHDARTQATVLARFREEAKLSYVLSQATLNVVRTIDFGATTVPTGAWVPFAVLEWLEGETLAEELRRRRAQEMRGRPLAEAMKLLEPGARALALAHQRRVAHRDVKPGNFFVLAPGAAAGGATLKLLDFGIAKVMREGSTASGTTSSGLLSFTPQYAAPEQIDPRYGGTGPWTDVYGLALVLLEVLTDRAPFDAVDLAGIVGAIIDPARRPTPRGRGAVVPEAVEAILARAVAVDPRQRFADAGQLWDALEVAGARVATLPPGSMQAVHPSYLPPIQPGPPPPPLPPSPTSARTANVVALVLGTGLTLLVLLALATWIVTRR
ncbi:MAG TPA: serine/threonine-protein kinase [Polyangiaceae bacterium]|jgi:serine/threonine-protein kinase